MEYPLKWILEAAKETSVPIRMLSESDAEKIESGIEGIFLEASQGHAIWERIKNPVSKKLSNGWEKACEYVGERLCFMMVETQGKLLIFEIKGMPELKKVLDASPPFEFSVCGINFEYLLSTNHHDYLIGAGECIHWLKNL